MFVIAHDNLPRSIRTKEKSVPSLLPHIEPDGLLEYSVVYTDRAYNHMSPTFMGAMRDISAMLKQVYGARSVVVVPGSGTFGMEAVARQFAAGKKCLVIRNGWFSFRWSQILDMGNIPASTTVMKARRVTDAHQAAFAPPPIAEVLAAIHEQKPDLVFGPRKKVVFVHGCFWHGHDCSLGRIPKSRVDFWEAKIYKNRNRDELHLSKLAETGWESLIIWECQLKRGADLENRIRNFLG